MTSKRKARTYVVTLQKGQQTRTVTVKALNLHLMHAHIREHFPQYDVPGPSNIRQSGTKDRHTMKDEY